MQPAPGDVAARIAREVMGRGPKCGAVRVLAIDGGAASGKSGLAGRVQAALGRHTSGGTTPSVALVHTDELLDGWDGQFTFWSRLRTDLLEPLSRAEAGYYRRYDWHLGAFAERVPVPVPDVLIVEGVSAIAGCGERCSYSVFLDVPRIDRELRWTRRDGSELQPEWVRWLDAEDKYFTRNAPQADLRLTGD